ncbi:MAG: orotidine-5'-phosphate decarboxylase [Parvularcula sp.]
MTADHRLIIALDVPTLQEATGVIEAIGDAGSFYKIGYQLFPIGGYDLATRLSNEGKKVFLDLKLLDIGATVERGVKSLAGMNADLLTVHADPDTIKGALAGRQDERLKVHAVTVLTSWDQNTLDAHGIAGGVMDLVLTRAEIAVKHGADGVIASAQEAAAIRARFGKDLSIVTPGIRPNGAASDDQKRIVTPQDALHAGADRLVVGRPIVKAGDPAAAAEMILREIAEA